MISVIPFSLLYYSARLLALALPQRRTSLLRSHSRSVDISESPRARRASKRFSPEVIRSSRAKKKKISRIVPSSPDTPARLRSPRRVASVRSPDTPKHDAGADGRWPDPYDKDEHAAINHTMFLDPSDAGNVSDHDGSVATQIFDSQSPAGGATDNESCQLSPSLEFQQTTRPVTGPARQVVGPAPPPSSSPEQSPLPAQSPSPSPSISGDNRRQLSPSLDDFQEASRPVAGPAQAPSPSSNDSGKSSRRGRKRVAKEGDIVQFEHQGQQLTGATCTRGECATLWARHPFIQLKGHPYAVQSMLQSFE